MGTRTMRPRGLGRGALLGVALLSLVFLGSPGCGCGDDSLIPPGGGQPERCCCDFEWLPPSNVAFRDVVITVVNEDPSLDATVIPSLLLGVIGREFEQFTVCVNEDHDLGATLTLVFTDNENGTEYGRAQLIYGKRCNPTIEPLTPEMNLVSTDCGGDTLQCCCDFEWLPGPNQAGDVTLSLENQGASLNGTVTPSSLSGVNPRELETFTICVDADHVLGESMVLVVRQQGSGVELGRVELEYNERCIPTVVPITAVPTLTITSTDCGGDPLLCCCDFEWLPGLNMSGDVNITAENVSPGLTVQITPSTLTGVGPRVFETFQVCINADHAPLDGFDLVITSTPGGVEFGRARIVYRLPCTPEFGNIPGAGVLDLTSPDCGGPQLQCCCDIEWLQNDPDFNSLNIGASVTGVDPSLITVTITPTEYRDNIWPAVLLFTVCVNASHNIGAQMTLVLTDLDTGAQIATLPLIYNERCLPTPGDPTGAGSFFVLCGLVDMVKPGR